MSKDKGATTSFRSHPVFVGILAVAALVALVAQDRLIPLDTPFFGLFQNSVDAGVYRAGGDMVLHGRALYGGNLIDELPFTYPPFAALLFTPLALVSMITTKLIFWVGNLVLLYAAVRLCLRHLNWAEDGWTRTVSMSLTSCFLWLEPVRMTVWFGQINLVLMVAVLWDLGRPEGSRLRGVAAGLAAGIKLTPGLFVVHLIVTRQWRAAAASAAAAASTVIVGFVVIFSDSRDFWFGAIGQSTRIGEPSSGANQSIRGALPRWIGEDPPPLLWMFCVLVVGVVGMTVAYLAHRSGRPLLGYTVCGLTAPMISPFSWGHHWVWFVPLIVLSIDAALKSRRRLLWVVPAAVTAPTVCWFEVYPNGIVAIGTFMLYPQSYWSGVLMQSAYPLTYLAVLVGVAAVVAPRRMRYSITPHKDPVIYITSRNDNGSASTRITERVSASSWDDDAPSSRARNAYRDTHSYRTVTFGVDAT